MPAAMFTLQLCVSGCMCVCGSSALLLAPRLKQCQRVCDETSQTILFFFFPFWLSLSRCLSSVQFIIQPPLSVSCPLFFPHYLSQTDTNSLWSSLPLTPPVPVWIYITVLYMFYPSSSLPRFRRRFSINHFTPRLELLGPVTSELCLGVSVIKGSRASLWINGNILFYCSYFISCLTLKSQRDF